MPDIFPFIVMSLALLLTPGPTNTLLAVGSAMDGLSTSLWLVPAELIGYLVAIHLLAFSIGPFVQVSPLAQTALRVVLSLYLLWLGGTLWVTASPLPRQKTVTPRRVFVVTLLNPKALIFAFVVLPPLAGGRWLSAAPYLIGLSVMIIGASLSWISLGTAIGSGRIVSVSPHIIRRLGATVLIGFAALIGIPHMLAVQ